jgi:hypothetical protein
MQSIREVKYQCNDDELRAEVRHKYYTILKSHYWEMFEEGKCMPDSISILLESADRCLDDESIEMCDWDKYLKDYIIQSSTLNFYIKISQMPFIGTIIQRMLY